MTASIIDFGQFHTLRAQADRNDPEALRAVAGQFEALFLQTMLKSMRDASLADPLFGDSDSLEMYQDMMDKQLSVEMASGRGLGFADMIVRQLGGEPSVAPSVATPHSGSLSQIGTPPGVSLHSSPRGVHAALASDSARSGIPASHRSVRHSETPPGDVAGSAPTEAPAAGPEDKKFWADAAEFAKDIWPHVNRVAKALNVSPIGVLAQTALETGWGKHVMPDGNGQNSFNLFGIKAGGNWSGDTVNKPTLEFEDGVAKRETARFRSYDEVAATFDDYQKLLTDSPRYASVANHKEDLRGFAEALQRSGYATDPAYAEKITRVAESPFMKRVLSGLKLGDSQSITSRLQHVRPEQIRSESGGL